MKVLAAPFEPPISAVAVEASDAVRRESDALSADQVAPISSVATGLNPATRESLSKLAILIRSQLRAAEQADEQAKEEKEERVEGERHAVSNPDEVLGRETVFKSKFPNVDRARHTLRAATRQRGLSVYRGQKSNGATDVLLNHPVTSTDEMNGGKPGVEETLAAGSSASITLHKPRIFSKAS